jgi:hypothetical protein
MPECQSCSGESLDQWSKSFFSNHGESCIHLRFLVAPDETNKQRVSVRFSWNNNTSPLPLKLGDGANDRPSDKICSETRRRFPRFRSWMNGPGPFFARLFNERLAFPS